MIDVGTAEYPLLDATLLIPREKGIK